MKKMIYIMSLGIAAVAFSATPVIEWANTNLRLGEIKLHEPHRLEFEFTNRSTQNVYILEAKGSCGCTIVDYPKTAVPAGSKAIIKAEFKPTNAGSFRKNIRIKTSTSTEPIYLYFSGSAIE